MAEPIYVGEVPGYLFDPARDDDPEALPGWFIDILNSADGIVMDFHEIDLDLEWFSIERCSDGDLVTVKLDGDLTLQGLITFD